MLSDAIMNLSLGKNFAYVQLLSKENEYFN
jgi:hypothetical protein